MNAERLAALKALCARASRGPWEVDVDRRDDGADQVLNAHGSTVAFMPTPAELHYDDAAVIAASRDALPSLIEEVERLHAGIDGHLRRVVEAYVSAATPPLGGDSARTVVLAALDRVLAREAYTGLQGEPTR